MLPSMYIGKMNVKSNLCLQPGLLRIKDWNENKWHRVPKIGVSIYVFCIWIDQSLTYLLLLHLTTSTSAFVSNRHLWIPLASLWKLERVIPNPILLQNAGCSVSSAHSLCCWRFFKIYKMAFRTVKPFQHIQENSSYETAINSTSMAL
jgi:hypothetical protein